VARKPKVEPGRARFRRYHSGVVVTLAVNARYWRILLKNYWW
jgi:hypothetical protein